MYFTLKYAPFLKTIGSASCVCVCVCVCVKEWEQWNEVERGCVCAYAYRAHFFRISGLVMSYNYNQKTQKTLNGSVERVSERGNERATHLQYILLKHTTGKLCARTHFSIFHYYYFFFLVVFC